MGTRALMISSIHYRALSAAGAFNLRPLIAECAFGRPCADIEWKFWQEAVHEIRYPIRSCCLLLAYIHCLAIVVVNIPTSQHNEISLQLKFACVDLVTFTFSGPRT